MKKKLLILISIFSLILAVACSPEIPADQPYMGEEEEIKTQWVDGT